MARIVYVVFYVKYALASHTFSFQQFHFYLLYVLFQTEPPSSKKQLRGERQLLDVKQGRPKIMKGGFQLDLQEFIDLAACTVRLRDIVCLCHGLCNGRIKCDK